jgi:hypothetical protein
MIEHRMPAEQPPQTFASRPAFSPTQSRPIPRGFLGRKLVKARAYSFNKKNPLIQQLSQAIANAIARFYLFLKQLLSV